MERSLFIGIVSVVVGMVSFSALGQTEPMQPLAADLVKEVRESAQWIHHIKSLRVHFDEVQTQDPRAIAIYTAELRGHGIPVNPKADMQLCPHINSTTDLTFDGIRHRIETKADDDLFATRAAWDGKTGFTYNFYKNSDPHLYIDKTELTTGGTFSFLGGNIWDISGMNLAGQPTPLSAERFEIIRQEKFRGQDCWNLATHLSDGDWPVHWFVGVADHHLYGEWKGSFDEPGAELARYQKIAGEDAAKLQTTADIRDWLAELPEARHAEVAAAYDKLQRESGHPAIEYWFSDYVEIRPGIWFAKRHGQTLFSDAKPGGGKEQAIYVRQTWEADATQIQLDEKVTDDLFTLESLQVPEGIDTADVTHEPGLNYKYKAHFTKDEWQAILDAAAKRDADAKRAQEIQRMKKQHNVG